MRSNSDGRFRLKSWAPSFLQHLVGDGKHTRKRNTERRCPGTPKTAIHRNTGDVEFGSPEPTQWTGRVPAVSGDVTHTGTASAFTLTATLRHVSTTQSAPPIHRNLFQKSSSDSTRVTGAGKLEEADGSKTLESQIDGERRNRRIRKVGLKLTATLLSRFSKVCHEENHSKIVQPCLDAWYVSRVDVLEVGGPTNSVLIGAISKMKRSSNCVNKQTRDDLHSTGGRQKGN